MASLQLVLPGYDVHFCKDLDGEPMFSRLDAVRFWEMMRPRDVWKNFFWQGGINGQSSFIDYLCRPGIWPIFISNDVGPASLVVLTNISNKSAQIHHCFAPRLWGRVAIKLGRSILEMLDGLVLASGEPKFYVLHGETPDWNVPAVSFLNRMGFRITGAIPYAGEAYWGKPGNLVISHRINPWCIREAGNG